MKIYLIGSLRNPRIPIIGNELRDAGHEVFDDWFSGGPEADDYWKKYEETRGRDFETALGGSMAQHIFSYDKSWLDWADAVVMACPAGKSGHLELGYMVGKGKRTYVLLDGSDIRWDVMYCFTDYVTSSLNNLIYRLSEDENS